MNKKMEKLKELYSFASKHSNYQILPDRLSEILDSDEMEIKSRYEKERMKYILENVKIKDKLILDIGGNTGFFTFQIIDEGAKRVHYYEGNNMHSEFVKLATKVLNLENEVEVDGDYFEFEEDKYERTYDITLLLNILHHIGDDYGDQQIPMIKAKEIIIKQINNLAKISDILILQLGFNWKGDRNLCLFENGTKEEIITFIKNNTKNNWETLKIGVAETINGKIKYKDSNSKNITRNDNMSEFLNRPIFIMKAVR